MTNATSPPAGWYDDGSGRQRWWDGAAWGPYAPNSTPAPHPAQTPVAVTPQRVNAPTTPSPLATPARDDGSPRTIATAGRALAVGSETFRDLQQQLTSLYDSRIHLIGQAKRARSNYRLTWLFSSKTKREGKRQGIAALDAEITRTFLDLTFRDSIKDAASWDEAVYHFEAVMKSFRIWDVTTTQRANKIAQRTVADHQISRSVVNDRTRRTLDFIRADVEHLFLPNLNGPDLYVFPTFIVLFKNYQQFSIHDLAGVNVIFSGTNFHETEGVPKDSQVVGHTWRYANKNGTPDKRFNNNFQIPIARYGDLELVSNSGINDAYLFSNYAAFDAFSNSLGRFLQANFGRRSR